jgi:hypothetical protein
MAHDDAIKEKAKDMYVINGLTVPTISSSLPKVSKYTLYRWRRDDNWDVQKKERVTLTAAIRARIKRALYQAFDSLEAKFDPKLVSSIDNLIATLKSTSTFEFTEELNQKLVNKKKGLTPEALKEIEEKLGILQSTNGIF